jgi:signal transduction histidine kinase
MSVHRRGSGPGAPISLQLVGLLLASLLAAEAISIAVILLMPPPRPQVYHVAEVAAALRGGPLRTRLGQDLVRAAAAAPPGDLRAERPDHERTRAALAAALGVPEDRVRFVQHSLAEWILFRRLGGRPPHHEGGPRPESAGPFGAPRPGSPPDHRFVWRRFGPDGASDIPIVGPFAAAVRGPEGVWVTVRSSPEAFPTPWQLRVALWLLAGFLVVAPAGYLFARRITAPLKRFVAAAEQLGRDPHAPLMTLSGPAEVGAAATAFNEMQARLKRYVSDRTAMVGAISHDLRTPLARIRFKMEAAPRRLKDSVLADVSQMEQMIGGVLAFIRDEGRPQRRERLDLLSVLECVADDAAMLGGDVEIAEAAPVTVDGDAVALQRLFGNLVDNAVKYGGEARIRVRREGEAAVVEIADRGPGLADDDLERAFQPFFRADPSRNLDKAGVGLGLPIARSTARAHGGDVRLSPGRPGLVAVVTLPAL